MDGFSLPPAPPRAVLLVNRSPGSLPIPGLIVVAGERAGVRFLEFFAAIIRNPHTRRAYARAVTGFLLWCEDAGVPSIAAVQPLHVATWIELQTRERAAPSVKQQLAAVRHLFDWLVTGQVMPTNPAGSVRGPSHIVRQGKTPVLDPAEARSSRGGARRPPGSRRPDREDAGDLHTYPNGGPVLPTARRRAPRIRGELVLDAETMPGFGTLALPRTLWRAMGRFAAWVEPALIAEWVRLMRDYAVRQDRVLDEGAMAAAMTWSEPARDVALPRERALSLLRQGEALHCVWSGRKLEIGTLDIDHCLPRSAWPCGDLTNLLPAHPEVNQRQKRDRLPGADLLRAAAGPIQDWWRRAYLDLPILQQRFGDEARASLPGLMALETTPPADEVFAALHVQRLRLRHDQQVPEWSRMPA
ncbi:MAG: site-specific integrase [Devosia sp.]